MTNHTELIYLLNNGISIYKSSETVQGEDVIRCQIGELEIDIKREDIEDFIVSSQRNIEYVDDFDFHTDQHTTQKAFLEPQEIEITTELIKEYILEGNNYA